MKTNWMLTTAAVAVSVTAAVVAQSDKAMHQPAKGDTVSTTYTGCVESVNHGAAYVLTKLDGSGSESTRGHETMTHHDDTAMTHDDMAKTSGTATMQQAQTTMGGEKMDAMAPKSFALAGSTDLKKHVGQKVSVTGSLSDGSMGTMPQNSATITIRTLKVIAKSCS